jgi:hypothetical protein
MNEAMGKKSWAFYGGLRKVGDEESLQSATLRVTCPGRFCIWLAHWRWGAVGKTER